MVNELRHRTRCPVRLRAALALARELTKARVGTAGGRGGATKTGGPTGGVPLRPLCDFSPRKEGGES